MNGRQTGHRWQMNLAHAPVGRYYPVQHRTLGRCARDLTVGNGLFRAMLLFTQHPYCRSTCGNVMALSSHIISR